MNPAPGSRRERQRGQKNEARSALVRERVLDYLNFSGGRRGPRQMENAREDFCRAAYSLAKREGMRMWKEESHPDKLTGPRESLKVLLMEKKVTQHGFTATGVNAAWVLDIWEATLDHLMRESVFSRRELHGQPEEADDDYDGRDPESGIQVVRMPPAPRSLSTRILEAYLAGDQDEVMQIAIEVEQLEIAVENSKSRAQEEPGK